MIAWSLWSNEEFIFLNLIDSLMKFSTCVIMLSANKEPQLSLSNLMVLFLFIVQFFWLRFLVPCWVGEKRGDTIVFVSHLKEKSSQRIMLLFGVFTFGFSNGLNKFFFFTEYGESFGHKIELNLAKCLFVSFEVALWLLSFILLRCSIIVIKFDFLKYPCTQGMSHTCSAYKILFEVLVNLEFVYLLVYFFWRKCS